MLSSRMTKTFRGNCNTNIVQQTSCEPLFPDVQMRVKNVCFRSFCTPVYASQLWCNFRKSCMQRLCVACNFGCRALYNLSWSWRASVGSHLVQYNIPTFEALLRKNVIFSKKMLDSLTTYGCVLRCCQIVYTIFAPFFEHYNRILLCD